VPAISACRRKESPVPDSATVKSVRRVFEVLELFERRRSPLTATQVGTTLRYPSSSVSSVLKSMVQLGYLSFDEQQKTYFPTPRLLVLGRWVDHTLFGRAELLELMQDLRAESGETVVLSARRDLEMQFMHIMMANQPIALRVSVGETVSMLHSAVGLAELAALPEDEVERLLERLRSRGQRTDRAQLADIMGRLASIRRVGYSAGYRLVSPDTGAVAIAIRSPAVGSRYVISVGGPWERIQQREEAIVRIMRRAIRSHLDSEDAVRGVAARG
jgi:DNA-binding IclR family transcriptional regulator